MSEQAETARDEVGPLRLSLEGEIRDAINRTSAENGSDTPDFILAQYLIGCLSVFNAAVKKREDWYAGEGASHDPRAGSVACETCGGTGIEPGAAA